MSLVQVHKRISTEERNDESGKEGGALCWSALLCEKKIAACQQHRGSFVFDKVPLL
jgi:hypothetical protein